MAAAPSLDGFLSRFAPVIFVWLWSTGFIGAKFGLPFAEPLTLLFYRALATLAVLFLVTQCVAVTWPDRRTVAHLSVTGLLVHGGYLSGVFYAIHEGLSAGLIALIVGLQPLLTVVLARFFLGERLTLRQFVGVLLGLVGIALVISDSIGFSGASNFHISTIIWALIALFSISAGTIYQKRFVPSGDLLTGVLIQYLAVALIFGLGMVLFEHAATQWNLRLILAIAWLVLALSVGAILLLMRLIRTNSSSSVASLFYLVPPLTAIEAYLLFDEKLGWWALCGGVLALIGVVLSTRPLKSIT